MIYVESKSNDPYYNLALEEYLFNNCKEECFILWQNDNTIVVGKYQNTNRRNLCTICERKANKGSETLIWRWGGIS